MSTLYRLKAYFGMVPAEDMDAYLDYGHPHDSYDAPGAYDGYDSRDHRDSRDPCGPDVGGHRDGARPGGLGTPVRERSGWARPERTEPARRAAAPSEGAERPRGDRGPAERARRGPAELPEPLTGSGPSAFAVGGRGVLTRGALAVEPEVDLDERPGPALLAAERPANPGELRELPLSRITTVHPRSYNEARTIGERYRDGIPVIINLTELDDAAAKRLVDFAAGLAFALRGSIDKVTNRVFLLSPTGVDVSAEDRRKLAERGLLGSG